MLEACGTCENIDSCRLLVNETALGALGATYTVISEEGGSDKQGVAIGQFIVSDGLQQFEDRDCTHDTETLTSAMEDVANTLIDRTEHGS